MNKYGKLQDLTVKALTDNSNDWLSMEQLEEMTGAYNQSIRRGLKALIADSLVLDKKGKKEPKNGVGLPKMYKLYKINL